MSSAKIFFDKIKEDRDWYFVEYSPPIEGSPLAYLHLVIPDEMDKIRIAKAMESEMHVWLARYPIPIEVFAWDGSENAIYFEPIKESDSLIGYVLKGQQKPNFRWGEIKWKELPQDALDRSYLKSIYFDIPSRTSEDIQLETKKHGRMVLTINSVFFIWAVVVPLIIIVLGETSVWVARMVLVYSLWKVVVELLKRTGRWKKSSTEAEREKEKRDRDHHHYHCKKNPDAFLRLKNENFERETRERIRMEAESLKQVSPL